APARMGPPHLPPPPSLHILTAQRYPLSLASPGLASLFCRLLFANLGHILGGLLPNSFRSARWHLSALFGLASDVTTTSALRRANARRNRLAKRTSTSHVAALYADADELAVQRRSMSAEAGQDGPAEVPTG